MELYPLTLKKRLISAFAALLALSLLLFYLWREPYRPLHAVMPEDAPFFSDDSDLQSLMVAAASQIHYLEKQQQDTMVRFSGREYPMSWLLRSARELLKQLQTLPSAEELDSYVKENYDIYQAGGRRSESGRRMLVTGYYEPVFHGSLKREPPYLTPIYRVPPTLLSVRGADGTKQTGRLNEKDQLVSFWSRAEIENKGVLAGYELAYLKDPFDAYLLHVQGSGKLRLPDNSIYAVRFAGSNGLEYKSIGKLLVDEKKIPLEEVSIPVIRRYLEEHPEENRRLLQANPRFIFFAGGDDLGPRGSTGEILTPERSIAIDWQALPGYPPAFLMSRRPVVDRDGQVSGWVPLNRFVFAQDSGSAIEGTGRVDLYWGNGPYAETAANHMKERGSLFFLVKKQAQSQ
jgi:membrane-bound lytic murein transglycosylase A